MARMTSMEALEVKIEKAQALVSKTKKQYDRSVMTAKPIEDIVKALNEIIDKNGPNYLVDEPFQVYTELIRSGNSDRKTAAALLHLLAGGLLETAGKNRTV